MTATNKTGGGRDQGFGDARGDDGRRRVALEGDVLEGRMMPSTVPNRPTNGAMTAIVPMIGRLRSSELRCSISAIESASVMSARFFSPREAELENPRQHAFVLAADLDRAVQSSAAMRPDLTQQPLRIAVLLREEDSRSITMATRRWTDEQAAPGAKRRAGLPVGGPRLHSYC
jgi:hypothetical protein